MRIKYLGYCGTPDPLEDSGMGLQPGDIYVVKEYRACCDDGICKVLNPVVSNSNGELIELVSDEYSLELESIPSHIPNRRIR